MVYEQLVPDSGLGVVRKLGVFTGRMEIVERGPQGEEIGRRTIQRVTLVTTDNGVFAIPGDMETSQIPWYEFRNVVPEDILKQMEKALNRGKDRRRKTKQSGSRIKG